MKSDFESENTSSDDLQPFEVNLDLTSSLAKGNKVSKGKPTEVQVTKDIYDDSI